MRDCRASLPHFRDCLALTALLTGSACTYWTSVPAAPGPVASPQQTVQVWAHGRETRVREAVVVADTLRGIDASGPGGGAAFLLPLAEIDSLRVGHSSGAGGILLAGAALAITGLILVASGIHD
jgi:hypothetical protein